MRQTLPSLLDSFTPAGRNLLGIGLSLLFFIGYLVILFMSMADPQARELLHTAPVRFTQSVLMVGMAIVLGAGAWLWPRRHLPDEHPRMELLIALTIGQSMEVLLLAVGPFTTPINMLIVGTLSIGMLLFSRRTMVIAFLAYLVPISVHDSLVLGGYLPYAPTLSSAVFPDGDPVWWWSFARSLSFYSGLVICVGVVFILFGRIDGITRELEHLATTDALTGLANRREFMSRLQAEVGRRRGVGAQLVVVLLDADHFKRVNDTHGHPAGDAVLRTLAGLMQADLRVPVDLAARIGGEEFALLLPDTDLEGARVVCSRLQERLNGHDFVAHGERFRVTVSIGVAEWHGEAAEALLRLADRYLYQAKQQGRNRIVDATAGIDLVPQEVPA